jgi:hypothetical protein
MKAPKISVWAIPVFATASIVLSGCGGRSAANPTPISYHEVGICKSYVVPTGTAQAKPDEGFAVFKIETIDNTKQNSSFSFDPSRFYVDQTKAEDKNRSLSFQTRRFVNLDPRFAGSMGVKALTDATVPANEKLDINTFIIVPLATNNPTGRPDVDQYSFDLVYDTSTTEKQWGTGEVVLTNTNQPGIKYPVIENCKELALK